MTYQEKLVLFLQGKKDYVLRNRKRLNRFGLSITNNELLTDKDITEIAMIDDDDAKELWTYCLLNIPIMLGIESEEISIVYPHPMGWVSHQRLINTIINIEENE